MNGSRDRFVLFDVEETINMFFRNTSQMLNADYDIHSILADYVLYRQRGLRFLDTYENYGFSEDDREDGRILYEAVYLLYSDLDRRLTTTQTPVVRCALSENRTDLLVEVSNENTGPRIEHTCRGGSIAFS